MAQVHAASGDVVDVRPLGPAPDGGLAQQVSTAILKSAQLELIRLVLPMGKGLREHHVQGEITVQCLEGLIEFTTSRATLRLEPGHLVHLQGGVPHSLLALADSSALLTICLLPPA